LFFKRNHHIPDGFLALFVGLMQVLLVASLSQQAKKPSLATLSGTSMNWIESSCVAAKKRMPEPHYLVSIG